MVRAGLILDLGSLCLGSLCFVSPHKSLYTLYLWTPWQVLSPSNGRYPSHQYIQSSLHLLQHLCGEGEHWVSCPNFNLDKPVTFFLDDFTILPVLNLPKLKIKKKNDTMSNLVYSFLDWIYFLNECLNTFYPINNNLVKLTTFYLIQYWAHVLHVVNIQKVFVNESGKCRLSALYPPTTLLNLYTENVLIFSSCKFLFWLKIETTS